MDSPESPCYVAFTAGKGGCGKTTLAINFANVLQDMGVVTLVVDFDLNNQGASGTFSNFTLEHDDYLTVHDLLNDKPSDAPLLQIKDRLFFMAAQRPGANPASRLTYEEVKSCSERTRAYLDQVAARYGIDCVILDCFCGIDPVTTAAIGCADHALLINEPDLVTFTGTLTMFRHLKKTYGSFPRSPKLHFIVNRIRPPHTVKSLVKLYRNNLQREIPEGVMCFFPYNERIFRNFGRHPLPSDLLPKSLFVSKLKLLIYLLFKDSRPNFLPSKLANWSQRRVRRVFLASVDPAAIDSETLILRLTRGPMLLMCTVPLVLAFALVLAQIKDPFFLPMGTLFIIAITTAILISLAHGYWSSARFNWTLASFLFRIAPSRTSATEAALNRIQAVIAGLAALCLFLFVLLGTSTLAFAMFRLMSDALKASTNEQTAIWYNAASSTPKIDVSNKHISGDYTLEWERELSSTSSPALSVNDKSEDQGQAVVNNTVFSQVIFEGTALSHADLDGTRFEDCIFKPAVTGEKHKTDAAGKEGEARSSRLLIERSTLSDVTLKSPLRTLDTPYDKLVLKNVQIEHEVKIHLSPGTYLELDGIRGEGTLTVANLAYADPGLSEERWEQDVVVSTKNSTFERLEVGPGVEKALKYRAADGRTVEADDALELTKAIEQKKKVMTLLSKSGRSYGVEQVNLIELQLMRGTEADLDRVGKNLEALDAWISEHPQAGLPVRGYHRMLSILYALVAYTDEERRTRAARAWYEWLAKALQPQGPADALSWSWSWELWHKNVNAHLPDGSYKTCYEWVKSSTRWLGSYSDSDNNPLPGSAREFIDLFAQKCADAYPTR